MEEIYADGGIRSFPLFNDAKDHIFLKHVKKKDYYKSNGEVQYDHIVCCHGT